MRQQGIVGIFVLVLILIVAVSGGAYYLGKVSNRSQVTETKQITQAIPTPDPTANWKIYTNTKYGYQLKYPPTWQLQDNSDSDNNYINFYPPQVNLALDDPSVPIIAVQVNSRPLSSYPTGNLTQEGVPMITDWKTVSVNGINGIYYQLHQCAPQCSAETILPVNQQETINLSISTVARDQGYINIYNQILSTLKFADQNQSLDTANWKTYTNTQIGFRIRYPRDLVVFEDSNSQLESGARGVKATAVSFLLPLPPEADPRIYKPWQGIVIWIADVQNRPVEDFIEERITLCCDPKPSVRYESIIIDGVEGKKVLDIPGEASMDYVFVKKGTTLYRFLLTPDNTKISLDTLYMILSTFRFTP